MGKTFNKLFVLAGVMLMATSCGGKQATGTAEIVKEASGMSYSQLLEAAKNEMQKSTGTFKVLGLTSVLSKAVSALAASDDCKDWLKDPAAEGTNTYVNNGYKDYTLLQALEPAADSYVADFALTQDERSIADYAKSGILHNYVPKDYASLGLKEADTVPLKGIHFNKIFWTNTNFTNITGQTVNNIWQFAAKKGGKDATDPNHIGKVSFQNPVTEQINMSFLLSCMAPANQARIEEAYEAYYGTKWAPDAEGKFTNAGSQWVYEFIDTVNTTGRWHSSDGTAMKETQLKTDWQGGYVYFGAYSKMKDAAGKYIAPLDADGNKIDVNADPILKDIVEKEGENAGKVNAMKTVKWDWDVKGFSGYFYTMDSQIPNNAQHPYTACFFARYLLNGDFYKSAIYNSSTPNKDGGKGNQYGYYYPGDMPEYSATETKPTTNGYDWTKAKWMEKSLVEDYSYLSTVKAARVAYISSLIKNAA